MLRFVICDDNHNHNRLMMTRLTRLLVDQQIKGQVALVTTDAGGVLDYSRQQVSGEERNAYLLDINLKQKLDGIELARQIREHDKKSYLVFITAYPEHVMRSVDLKVSNYLIKPVSKEILAQVLLQIYRDYLETRNVAKRLRVQVGSQIHFVEAADIIYIESFHNKIVIRETTGCLEAYDSLSNIEGELMGEGFYRCHRSFLVNLHHIKNLDLTTNRVIMSNGDACFISSRQKKGLMAYAEHLI